MGELSFEGCKGIDEKDGDCGREQGGRGNTHSGGCYKALKLRKKGILGSIRGKCSGSEHIELQCTTLRQ